MYIYIYIYIVVVIGNVNSKPSSNNQRGCLNSPYYVLILSGKACAKYSSSHC